MSLKPVPLLPERMYHMWTHANGSEDLFRSEENYRYFLKRYAKYIHPIADTYAYCLMPNHLHFMVRIKKQGVLLRQIRKERNDPTLQGFETLGGWSRYISQLFSNMLNGYGQSYNRMYGRKGSLFIPNFRRRVVDSDEYFIRLIVYIHNNPVHHGFVKSPGNWKYSSWRSYLTTMRTRVRGEEGISWFGSQQQFLELHRILLSDTEYPLSK